MADVSAAAVKELRELTGLPMMDCKQALTETKGDKDAAVTLLRERNKKVQETRLGRDTEFGRIGVYADDKVGALVELMCESAPVATSPDFKTFANDLAQQLAKGPGAKTAEELLKQPSPRKPGMTLGEEKDEMFSRIREVFKLGRVMRVTGPAVGYVHATGDLGSLVQYEGSDPAVVRDVAMHIVAQSPTAVRREDLDPAEVQKEKDFQTEQARKEGKPDNIIQKMIEGRMRNFYAARVLIDQPFVKDETQTVGKVLDAAKTQVKQFANWKLGKA
ncbi:MAG: translation elongation factor Ts [Planctomycetes bacterium]|nr:translation elongation factor Ts [Planctomycetota bacterium]